MIWYDKLPKKVCWHVHAPARAHCHHCQLGIAPQIYKGDPRTYAIFIPAWGSNLGFSGFSRNQNNRGSSGAYVTCIYCDLSVKINTHKMPHGVQRSWTHLLCIYFCVCGRQKPKDPQFERHGWCHNTGQYSRSGISLVYVDRTEKQSITYTLQTKVKGKSWTHSYLVMNWNAHHLLNNFKIYFKKWTTWGLFACLWHFTAHQEFNNAEPLFCGYKIKWSHTWVVL